MNIARHRFLTAVTLSLFGALALYAASTNASPPTHYIAYTYTDTLLRTTGPNPDVAAQAYVSAWNAKYSPNNYYTNLQSCRLLGGYPAPAAFECPADFCIPAYNNCYLTPKILVDTRCGPQSSANWTGTEFVCPESPEPGCEGAGK